MNDSVRSHPKKPLVYLAEAFILGGIHEKGFLVILKVKVNGGEKPVPSSLALATPVAFTDEFERLDFPQQWYRTHVDHVFPDQRLEDWVRKTCPEVDAVYVHIDLIASIPGAHASATESFHAPVYFYKRKPVVVQQNPYDWS